VTRYAGRLEHGLVLCWYSTVAGWFIIGGGINHLGARAWAGRNLAFERLEQEL
jgi:hypothetical protein